MARLSKFERARLAGTGPGSFWPRCPGRRDGAPTRSVSIETDARSLFAGPDGPARRGAHTAPHILSARSYPAAGRRDGPGTADR